MKLKSLLFVIHLLIISTAAGCRYENNVFDDKDLKTLHEKSYPISQDKQLNLETSMGDIMISGWDKEEVYIKVLGNEKANEKIEFEFNGNENLIEVIAKKDGSVFNWFSSGIALRFEIKVPQRFNNKVHTSGGDIKISDITGKNIFKTSGGDLWVKKTSGELEISTSGGDINLDENKGNISASTSGGDISAKTFDGDLVVSTSGGNINLKGTNSKIDAQTSGGDIYLEYWGENKGIDLATSGGDINIKVPAEFNANVKLTSSGGDVSTEIGVNNVKKVSSQKLEGELNKGGILLKATTSGGDVTLSKL
ncbi:MAG TPA: DUF4097 family beta strand repeat-containing protein [Ignavibacteriaceae bacterium]|nr:DUF4097 family beta strand repeat-containing protein [Ignavibacteriaceae bacterium]